MSNVNEFIQIQMSNEFIQIITVTFKLYAAHTFSLTPTVSSIKPALLVVGGRGGARCNNSALHLRCTTKRPL
jgi:hypothetical protein